MTIHSYQGCRTHRHWLLTHICSKPSIDTDLSSERFEGRPCAIKVLTELLVLSRASVLSLKKSASPNLCYRT